MEVIFTQRIVKVFSSEPFNDCFSERFKFLPFRPFAVAIDFTQPIYNVKENDGTAQVGISVTDGVISEPTTVRYLASNRNLSIYD